MLTHHRFLRRTGASCCSMSPMAHSLDSSLDIADVDKDNPRHDMARLYLAQAPVFAKLFGASLAPGVEVSSASFKHERLITEGEYPKTPVGFADLYTDACVLRQYVTAPERIFCPPEDEATRVPPLSDRDKEDPLLRKKHERAEAKRYEAHWAAWEAACANAPQTTFPVFGEVAVLIEVKIQRVPVGTILRQIQLYSQYLAGLGRDSVYGPEALPPEAAAHPRYRECPRARASHFDCRCRIQFGSDGVPRSLSAWARSLTIVVTDYPLTTDEVDALRSANIEHARLGAGFEAYVASQATAEAHASLEI